MGYLAAFVAGAAVTLGVVAPFIASNRRRIRRLEARQRAHGVVLRDLGASRMGPEEPPPIRRASKAAVAVGALSLLMRRHPVRAVLAASGTAAGATVVAVALAPGPAARVPSAGAVQPPVALTAFTAPAAAPRPAPSRSAALVPASSSAPVVPGSSSGAPVSSVPAPVASSGPAPVSQSRAAPVLSVSLPVGSVTVAVPSLAVSSLLPSLPVPSGSPSVSASCLLDVALPAVLNACVL